MRAASGKVESIDIHPVTFSSNADKDRNANEWVIEPELVLEQRDNCITGAILFLGIVGIKKTQEDTLLASHHFQTASTAWRTQEQFDAIIYSLKAQIQAGAVDEVSVHKDYTGSRAKWFAKEHCGKLCVVASSNNFYQELAEECVDGMKEMVANGMPSKNDLWKLGVDIQVKGVEMAAGIAAEEEEEEETREDVEETRKTLFESIKDVPISLLHRSGTWFCLDEDTRGTLVGQDSLYIQPVEHPSSVPVRTVGDYFQELTKCAQGVTIKNDQGQFLCCKERKNRVGADKRDWSGNKYLMARYQEPGCEAPEVFTVAYNNITGAYSIQAESNGLFLKKNEKGEFVFAVAKENGEASWLIDAADLQSGASSDAQLLFAGVIKQSDGELILSKHAPNRPPAWRTDSARDIMISTIIADMGDESSTVITDSDTGFQWFASTPDGKKIFLVVTSEGFPWLFGFKAVMAVEHLHIEKKTLLSPDALHHAMRSTETECKYAMEFGDENVRSLINSAEQLKALVRANMVEANKKTENLEALQEKVDELNEMAEQFYKMAKKLPDGRSTMIVVGGVVGASLVGGSALAICCASPATAPIVGTAALSLAEAFLSVGLAAGGATLGGLTGAAYSAGMFTKRPFVSLGECVNTRINTRQLQKRRGARIGELVKETAKHERKRDKMRVKAELVKARAFDSGEKVKQAMSRAARTRARETRASF